MRLLSLLLCALLPTDLQGHEHRASVYVHSSGPSPWTLSADGNLSPLFLGRNVPSSQVWPA